MRQLLIYTVESSLYHTGRVNPSKTLKFKKI